MLQASSKAVLDKPLRSKEAVQIFISSMKQLTFQTLVTLRIQYHALRHPPLKHWEYPVSNMKMLNTAKCNIFLFAKATVLDKTAHGSS